MLDSVARLLKEDVERQTQWAREEARQQMRSLALAIGLMLFAAMSALALFAVGLVGLFLWAEPRYGAPTALGFVAAALCVAMLVALCVYFFMKSKTQSLPRPQVQSTNPAALKAAFTSDAQTATDQTIAKLRESPLGSAISAGEQALQTGERLVRVLDDLKGQPTSTVLLTLAAAVVVGTVIGRKL